MKYFCVIIVFCFALSESLPTSSDKYESLSPLKVNSTSEQKIWNIKLDINFSKSLPNEIKKPPGSDVRFKCEAVMNFTKVETLNKEGKETSLQEVPDHILPTLMRNMKVYWLKDKKLITESQKIRITTKIDKTYGTIGTNLRIKDLESADDGNYTCVIKQTYEKRQTSRLKVVADNEGIKNYEIPTYTSLFPNSEITNEFEIKTTDDECYWENGNGYLGTMSIANNGMPCIEWSKQLHVRVSDYPELIGRHNYCRNPGRIKSQPWCIVEKEGKIEKQLCNIPKCKIPIYPSLFPTSDITSELEIKSTPNLIPEGMRSLNVTGAKPQNNKIPDKLEPICQEYMGKVCAKHLRGQYVYIPYDTTQAAREDKLIKAIQVTKYSNDISSHCEGYALPSLCYSTFPICRDPLVTNDNFFKEAKQVFAILSATTNSGEDNPQIVFENLPHGVIPQSDRNISIENLNYRYNSTVLRRVCKQDCEILENELCQTEYAIAKRHPHIGQQLTLEECQDLPEDDPDCLKIDIGAVMVSDDECYWENGNGYLGTVSVADNGMSCIEWSKQLHVRVSDYPELAGRHSYCRNPGRIKSQPWCIVDKEGKTEKQLCDIPKCAHKIWIYIVIVFLLLTLSIVGFIICLCYRHKNKGNAATIRDINLPNADKNIYGNSRLNSPIEMSDLLTNQNINNQPHLTRNTRGNGVLRIPQYSLSQIKFLEELGEGAFGKVYKGALKKSGDTQYVAVKALKENASAKTQSDFRREIDLISELTHDNIVCIVGVALREEPLCMLFEFMARGDLHEFLMGRAPPSGKGLPPMRLLNIAHNIASGMQYLASHHYVHRDLAARNCLVSDDFVVKISDFGLSRDIYSSDYYRVQSKSLLPVRWMPPESILYGKFTTESDIWSYGVVLWEIYSYGLQPYYGYSNQEVISMVRGGELLAAPAACPALMYTLMRDCWKHTPQRRPNFEEIVNRIGEWIQMGGCPESAPSDSGSSGCGHRPSGSTRDLQERVPLLPPHCSSSNGSLATGSLKKFTTASSSSKVDDNCSTCSEVPPLVPKAKKHSSGSLIDTDKLGTKETVVRIPNAHFGNEI